MSFAGHVFDMINRLRYNESLKERHRESYTRIRELYQSNLRLQGHYPQKDVKIAPEQLFLIKQKIRKEIYRENVFFTIKVILFTSLIVCGIVLLIGTTLR